MQFSSMRCEKESEKKPFSFPSKRANDSSDEWYLKINNLNINKFC